MILGSVVPFFDDGTRRIHYEDEGSRDEFPILLIASGGMRSAAPMWGGMAWNPRTELSDYRIIAMDQRNAGQSSGPVSGADGWEMYRDDQLALLDHLGIEQCHAIGMCIGGPYIFGLLRAASERFRAAVMFQPVGIDNNRDALNAMFDTWKEAIADDHREADEAAWVSFRHNMWGGEFVLTATPEQLEQIDTPSLVLMGNDLYHPESTSREIVARMPNAHLIERWKDAEFTSATHHAVSTFLERHTP